MSEYRTGGKIEFCRLARKMIEEEHSGRGDYSLLIAHADDWKDEINQDSAEERAVSKILTTITAIRNQESNHEEILKRMVNSHCVGVGE